MADTILPMLALLLAMVLKSYSQDSVVVRKQLWEPGENPHGARIKGGCTHAFQSEEEEKERRFLEIKHDLEELEIPENFDARENWPNCPSIREISNQAHCGSCWAFGSVEAMSDRICIHSSGKINFRFSADDLVSCCRTCGGCNGSTIKKAYDYWVKNGIVSGGAYGSNEGCRPYEIRAFLKYFHLLARGASADFATPTCVKRCERSYKIPYEQDLHFGRTYYSLKNDVKQIQAEIMSAGPVTASFRVYDDFMYEYTGKGIYHHIHGKLLGGHAVKLIGWGVENGTDYWIVANSWGTGYGDNGFFKFIRGENDCNIEEGVWGGIPAYS